MKSGSLGAFLHVAVMCNVWVSWGTTARKRLKSLVKGCEIRLKPSLTVLRCFLRMYMMKPHILDVTPRKVRMPSKHCRVFSMLTSTQRPHSNSTSIVSVKHAVAQSYWGNCWRNSLASESKSVFSHSRQTSISNSREAKQTCEYLALHTCGPASMKQSRLAL